MITKSLYSKMGILDLIADNTENYIKKANLLGNTPSIRNNVEDEIFYKRNFIFEDQKSIKEWEEQLTRIHKI